MRVFLALRGLSLREALKLKRLSQCIVSVSRTQSEPHHPLPGMGKAPGWHGHPAPAVAGCPCTRDPKHDLYAYART